jgi:hypothetical protein
VSDAPYRVQPPKPPPRPDPYLLAWARLRVRRAVAWGAALLSAIAFTALVVALAAHAGLVAGLASGAMMVCWVSWIVALLVLRPFRCPRCEGAFHGSGPWQAPPWTDACAVCGIAIGTPRTSGDAAFRPIPRRAAERSFVEFLFALASGRGSAVEWEQLVVTHYLDLRVESARQDLVRAAIADSEWSWADPPQSLRNAARELHGRLSEALELA